MLNLAINPINFLFTCKYYIWWLDIHRCIYNQWSWNSQKKKKKKSYVLNQSYLGQGIQRQNVAQNKKWWKHLYYFGSNICTTFLDLPSLGIIKTFSHLHALMLLLYINSIRKKVTSYFILLLLNRSEKVNNSWFSFSLFY